MASASCRPRAVGIACDACLTRLLRQVRRNDRFARSARKRCFNLLHVPDRASFVCYKARLSSCSSGKKKAIEGQRRCPRKSQTISNPIATSRPERDDRRPKLALRQRASDHPMAMFMRSLAACAFCRHGVRADGPARPSLRSIRRPTSSKARRRPPRPRACRCRKPTSPARARPGAPRATDCLRVIAEQSGEHRARAIRMIANAAPLTNTPNTVERDFYDASSRAPPPALNQAPAAPVGREPLFSACRASQLLLREPAR